MKQLHRGTEGLVKIRTHKDRRGYLARPLAAELELRSDPVSHAISWAFRPAVADPDQNGWRPTVLMEKVSRYLEQQPEAVSRNDVERHVTGMGEYVRAAMDALVADGYATETAGPRRARLLSSVRSFRTASDLVATSSDELIATSSLRLAPTGATKTKTKSVDDVDEDEVERLAALARDFGLTDISGKVSP